MANRIGILGRIRARAAQGAQTWLRPLALLGVVAASCGEAGNDSGPGETLGQVQEAVVDQNAALLPGEVRGGRVNSMSFWPWNHADPIAASELVPLPDVASGSGRIFNRTAHPAGTYWIAAKHSPNQGDWVTHLFKSKAPPPGGPSDGTTLWLTHSQFIPAGQVGPGGVVAGDPPGLVNGEGFVTPTPTGGALTTPIVSGPGAGVNGTRPNWTSGPADTGAAVRVRDLNLMRIPFITGQVVRQSFLAQAVVYVPSHPERAGGTGVGNAVRHLQFLQRGGVNLASGGTTPAVPIDFTSVLDQWAWLHIRTDVTTGGGLLDGSSDDSAHVRYSIYLEGQLVGTYEPALDAAVLHAQVGPLSTGPGFGVLRGWEGDAPEAFLDALDVYAIVPAATPLMPGESLGAELWSETFGTPGDGTGSSLSQSKFVSYTANPARTIRLFDPSNTQKSGTTNIAYKGTPANPHYITDLHPHFAPGENCTANPPPADCLLPGGGIFDGTAMWLSHSRFSASDLTIKNQISPPATGTLYDGTQGSADSATYVRPIDAHLIEIPFLDGKSERQSYLISADVYVPRHVGGHEWLRVIPYSRRGTLQDPTYPPAFEIGLIGLTDRWFRMTVRADVTTHGNGPGTADDKADILLQFLPDGSTIAWAPFAGTYANVDNTAKLGTGGVLKFGVSYGIMRVLELDALEAYFDNFSVQKIEGRKICDDDSDCTNGQVCGVGNGAAFGLPATTGACWDPVCNTAAAANCGSAGATCGFCPNGTACTSDAGCEGGSTCRENGRYYDKPYNVSVCAPEICETDPVAGGCGTASSPCGKCEGVPKSCATSADCDAPDVCGANNGDAFGLPAGNYCWSPVCNEPAITTTHCGTTTSECGVCDCSANCTTKTCGDDPSDGCGGVCLNLCDAEQPGCSQDAECAAGLICAIGAGPRFGHASGTNVCLPPICRYFDQALPNCGVGAENCGACNVQPDCSDKPECSSDGACGTCTEGQVCNPAGRCVAVRLSALPPNSELIPPPLPQESTTEVGATNGLFEVNDRGQAHYRIPLDLPRGRLGMVPDLALEYYSGNAYGMMGFGWRLAGLSTIARCPKTVAVHGSADPVTFTETDSYCLDGQRLIPVAGTTGDGSVTEYRTEVDSFRRITSNLVVVGPNGYIGPQWFKVEDPDGKVHMYGSSVGGSVAANGVKRIWALERTTDRAGNYIEFRYRRQLADDDTAELLPEGILWGGLNHSGGRTEDRWVQFTYFEDPWLREQYSWGVVSRSGQRLTQIDVFAGGALSRRYKLDYDNWLQQQVLEKITECTLDPTEGNQERCKTPTTFTYDRQPGYSSEGATFLTTLENDFTPIATLDYTGDGDPYQDLLVAGANRYAWQVFINQQVLGGFYFVPGPQLHGCDSPIVLDINRDQRDDIVCGRTAYIARDQDYTEVVILEAPVGGEHYRRGDFNGDGLPDLLDCSTGHLHLNATNVISTYWDPGLSDKPFTVSQNAIPTASINRCITGVVLDADGDGDSDYVAPDAIWSYKPGTTLADGTFVSRPAAAMKPPGGADGVSLDINGDGLLDVLWVGYQTLMLWQNTGKFFDCRWLAFDGWVETPSPIPGYPPPQDPPTVPRGQLGGSGGESKMPLIVDLDRDGADEFVAEGFIYRFVDKRLQAARAGEPVQFFPYNLGAAISNYKDQIQADLNGDGVSDLVRLVGRQVHYNLGRSTSTWSLMQVVDGLGKTIDIKYEPRSGADIIENEPENGLQTYDGTCTQEPEPPVHYDCVRRVGGAVSEHTIHDGSAAGQRFLHTYGAKRVGLAGRGSFGFAKRSIHDVTTRYLPFVTNISLHNTDYLRATRRHQIEKIWASTNRTGPFGPDQSRSTVQNFLWNSRTSSAGRPFPVLSEESLQEIEGAGSSASVARRVRIANDMIDNYGNVERRREWTYVESSTLAKEVVTETPFSQEEPAWLVRQLDGVTKTDTRYYADGTQEQSTRRLTYEYYPNGMLHRRIREPGDDILELTTTWVRDELTGNVEEVSENDGFGEERTQSVVWDVATEMYPVELTDPLQFTTYLAYSITADSVVTSVDPRELASQHAFDGFGRLRRSVEPTSETRVFYSAGRELGGLHGTKQGALAMFVENVRGGGLHETDVDAFGRIVRRKWDGFGGLDVIQEREFDAAGRLAVETQPHATNSSTHGAWSFAYDGLGRPTQVTLPDDSVREHYYATRAVETVLGEPIDPMAVNLSATFNPRGGLRVVQHDVDGRPLRIVEPPNLDDPELPPTGPVLVTGYRYGPFDVVRRVRNAVGSETEIIPDELGRVRYQLDPNTGPREYTYNAFGELTSYIDGDARRLTYEYDVLSRLRFIRSEIDTIAEYVYDEAAPGFAARGRGQLTSMWRQKTPATRSAGTLVPGSTDGTWVRFSFGDQRGRLQSIDHELPGEPALRTTFQYDAVDLARIAGVNYPAAVSGGAPFSLTYQYDPVGNLKGILGPSNEEVWRIDTAVQGLMIESETYGNGISVGRSYFEKASTDPNMSECEFTSEWSCMPGRLHSISTLEPDGVTAIETFRYHYDRNGNVAARRHERPNAAVQQYFAYDSYDRLVKDETFSGDTKTFSYDGSGNLKTVGSDSYAYDPQDRPELPNVARGITLQYDNNGRVATRAGAPVNGGSQEFSYTEFDLPWKVLTGSVLPQVEARFEYDGMGRRVARRMSAVTTIFAGEAYERTTDTSLPGRSEHTYRVRAYGREVAQFTRVVDAGQVVSSTVRYLHQDALGTTTLISSESANVTPRPLPDAFGASLGIAPISDVDTGYTGHRDETALGLINMRGRFYDPYVGRFLTPDPFVINPHGSQGLNRYSYVRNNPLTFKDPSGFQEQQGGGPGPDNVQVMPPLVVTGPDTSAGGAERGGGSEQNGGPSGSIPGAVSTPETANNGAGDPGMSITSASGGPEQGGPGQVTIPYFYPLYNVPDRGPQRDALDELQAGLDLASIGLDLTGVGATISWVPDVVNGCISLCRGDEVGAGLSFGAAIPAIGVAANATRLARLGDEGAEIARIAPGSLPADEEAALLVTLSHVDAGTKPPGPLAKKWGTSFKNWSGDLPGASGGDSPYLEYRVAPPAGTTGAGEYRVVANSQTGEVYFTWTHYGDSGDPAFVQIR